MGYSEDASMVRVDFFKASGKWYCTEVVRWAGAYSACLIGQEFARSLHAHLVKADGTLRLSGMTAVCLKPFHQHAHPLMLAVDDIHALIKEP